MPARKAAIPQADIVRALKAARDAGIQVARYASAYFDRHGRRRWRFRKGGVSVELGTDYGSEDFVRRYEAAVEGQRVKGRIGATRTVPGSLSALVASYYRSPAFLGLSEKTRRDYQNIIEKLRAAHGDERVTQGHLERRHIMALLAEKADTPAAANVLRKRLLAVLDHAVDLGWRQDNPAATVKPYRYERKPFHTWTEDEIARFNEAYPIGTLPRLAMTLMLHTGAAKVDAARLGWQNVKDGRISYRRQKTLRSGGELIDIRILPELAAVLDALPRDRLTFLETRDRKSRSPDALGNFMRGWCDKAGLPECTSHGLRKAMGRRLAEGGATPHMIKVILGHKSLAMVQHYTSAVDGADLADAGFETLGRPKREQTLANHPKRFAKVGDNLRKRKET